MAGPVLAHKKLAEGLFLRRIGFLVLALVVVLASASPANAMIVTPKLSDEQINFGGVRDFFISPDSKYVVYAADTLIQNYVELFSVPAAGGVPVKLNLDLDNGGMVDSSSIAITPDSRTVVYRADQNGDSMYELYTVPITGGDSLRIDNVIMGLGSVQSFELSTAGDWVVYRADQEVDEQYEIYRVPITGTETTKLNGTLVIEGDVFDFLIRPDGNGVVYKADQDAKGRIELYGNSMDGEHLVKLSGTITPSIGVSTYAITSNSLRVVFMAPADDGLCDLYTNILTGGEPTKINGELSAGEFVEKFTLSHNGLGVVFTVGTDHNTSKDIVYSRYLAGGAIYRLSGDTTMPIHSLEITPKDDRVVYHSNPDIYSNGIFGGAPPVRLNDPASGDGYVWSFQITPNSLGVVYKQNQVAGGGCDLYSAYTAGGSAHNTLNLTLHENDNVARYGIAPNGASVVFIADQDTDNVDELYLTSILGGTPIKLNRPIQNPAGDVYYFKFNPDGQLVAFTVDQEVEGKYELFVAFNGYGIFLPNVVR